MEKISQLLKTSEMYDNTGNPQSQNPEDAFKSQVQTVLGQFVESKYPWIRPESSINIIKTDVDNNYVVASIDLNIQDVDLKIPIIFSEGKVIEPWAIYLEGEDRFIPFTQDWYEKILNSLEVNEGTVIPYSNNGYANAYNTSNRVIEPQTMGKGYYRYAALKALDDDELYSMVKTAMANGYVYNSFGREAIKVAAERLISKNRKKASIATGLKINKGYTILSNTGLKKVTAGLTLGERSEAYNSITKRGYAIIDKRLDKGQLNIVELKDDSVHLMTVNSLIDHASDLVGSFHEDDPEKKIFYIPNEATVRSLVAGRFRNEFNKEYNNKYDFNDQKYNKHIFRNQNAEEDFLSTVESLRDKSVPEFISKLINNELYEVTNFEKSRHPFVCIKVEPGCMHNCFNISDTMGFEDNKVTLNFYKIKSTSDGYLVDVKDHKYAVVPSNKLLDNGIYTDMIMFIADAMDLRHYFCNGFKLTNNTSGIKTISVETKEGSYHFNNLPKTAAYFVLGNYFKIEDPVSFLETYSKNSSYKFAMETLPEGLGDKLKSLMAVIDSIKGSIEEPENQKQAYDSTNDKGSIDVNIENINMGGAEGPVNEAVMDTGPVENNPQDVQASESGIPDMNTLIQEALKLGIPQDLIDGIISAAPNLGVSPEEAIIQAGSMVEDGIGRGIPIEELINALRNSVQSSMASTGGNMPAEVSTAANVPVDQLQSPEALPVQTDAAMQQAGSDMVSQMPQGTPIANTPITNTMANPMVQQVMEPVAESPEQVQEIVNRSVLADIISNATLKTKFMDYIPVLNDTIDTLSEMILKIELNKASLQDEVGLQNVEEVTDKLREVLKQMGDIILRIVNFK